MASYRLKRKIFFIGLGNLGNAISGTKTLADGTVKTLGTMGKAWEATKGMAKLGTATAAVATPIMLAKVANDVITGKPLEH